MKRFCLFVFIILIFAFPVCVFSQQAPSAGALRDYVGLINQSYHPGIVAYFEKIKADLEKAGQKEAVKSIDLFLKGATGSGFVVAGTGGKFYVVTNYHVVQQAHTLSITFERQDNFKKQYDNLTIIAADEETDLALLAFPAGNSPSSALSFVTRRVEEGEDVYAAGFPALGVTPIWQFSKGMVSNASVSFPKSLLDETLMGPYIQHTAQVDPGNSGGPLLVLQKNAPSGYAVAGVNTLSALRRQTANFSIPANKVQTFINTALNQKPETYRADLDQRLDNFLKGLGENRAVYPHIANYLSSICVGENAEYAMSEMYDKGSSTVRRSFIEKCEDGVVDAMGYAVAWTIENSLREQGGIRATLKDVNGSGEEYTVVFTINNKDVNSIWIREYGNWRIKSFGSVASGDKSLISKKETEKKDKENLRLDSPFHVEAGYAYLFNKENSNAIYLSLDLMGFLETNMYFVSSDFYSLGLLFGYRWEIPAKKFGFMPYVRIGFNYLIDKNYKEYEEALRKNYESPGFPIAFAGKLGLKITSSYVPGLFFGTAFQINLFDFEHKESSDKRIKFDGFFNKQALSFCIGYAF